MSGEKPIRRCTLTLGETGSEQTRNLLDEGLRGKESVVLLGELLNKLLVLVKPYMKHEKRQTRKKIALRTSSNHQQTCTQEKSP